MATLDEFLDEKEPVSADSFLDESDAPDYAKLSEDVARREDQRRNLGAIAGAGLMAPGGPESDLTRKLFVETPLAAGEAVGRGLHAVISPIERYAAGLSMAAAPDTFTVDPERTPVAVEPGKTIIPELEPPPEARGVIPSIRRVAAGMTTPGSFAIAPFVAARPVQGVFALGAASNIPAAARELALARTPAETRGALTDIGLNAIFSGTMGREAVRPRTSARPSTQRTPDALQPKTESPVPDVLQPEVSQEGARQVPTSQDRPQTAQTLTPAVRSESGAIEIAPDHGTAQLQLARKGEIAVQAERPQDFGFVDETGKFITREEAVPIFEKIYGKKPSDPNRLTSEDLKAQAVSEPVPTLESDKALYKNLTTQMVERMRSGDISSPEFKELTRQIEVVKNRHGGMPPGQTSPARVPQTPAPVEQPGITTEQVPALGYLPRQSEIAGMGEPSMPPTIESVRAQRRAEAARPEATEPTMFPVEGESIEMRKSAERATTAPAIPEPVQQLIATAEESFYRQQSMAKVVDVVSTMSDADLVSVPRDSNLYTAAKLEQANRLFKAGKNDEGYNVFVELEKEGTRLGQLINQFKLLKSTRPEEVVRVINKTLEKSGKDPLPKPAEEAAIKTASKSKEADRKLEEATDEWAKNPTPENAAKAEQSLLDANEAGLELQRFVSKYQPRSTSSIIKSVLQGNLLTPISEVANIVGNMAFLPFRASTRGVATAMDVLNNYLTKTPRQITVQPIRGTAEALKGFGRGAAKIPDVFLRGTGDVIKGETRAGLHPVKAWINQFSKNPEMPTTGGKLTLQDRLNLAIEGTFGVPAEAMLRGLGAGDVAFKEAAKARATATELSLAKVPKDQWAFAQKFPELFLAPEAMQRIQTDTLQAVFQRPSKTLSLFTNWLKGKGEIADLFAATIAPYKLTPWNIIGEILSYNPLIAAARSVNSSRLKNPREARLNAGKFVVGSMVTAAGWWLYKNGLMSPSLDQRDEAQKARVLAGEVMPPNHINLSGLKRKLEGGDPTYKPGDETVDVFRAGGLAGSMFYMTANIGRDFERRPEVADSDVWFAILRQSTLEQARFGMNQSFLSGIEGLLSAVREGNTDNYIRQWGNTVASIPLPNTLTVMSRASREYKPDFREDTFRKQMENIARNKLGIANLDDYLPLKRGLWGEPMRETPEGRNAIMYHFFDVFKNKQVTSDPVPLELFRLWRKTGDSGVVPSIPAEQDRVLTVGSRKYPMNAAQYSRYAELVGKARRRIVDAVVVNPEFHKLPDEAKIKLLDRIYRAGLDQGKGQFWQEFGGTLQAKPERAGFGQ